jgi:hypothetical protein
VNIDDDDIVYAFQPRAIDPPQFVGESAEDVADRLGEWIGADQCDCCGNSVYEITEDVPQSGRFYAVCVEDPDDEVSRQFGGCGNRYPIRRLPAREVQF